MHISYTFSFDFAISCRSNFLIVSGHNVLLRIHHFWQDTFFIGKVLKVVQISKL